MSVTSVTTTMGRLVSWHQQQKILASCFPRIASVRSNRCPLPRTASRLPTTSLQSPSLTIARSFQATIGCRSNSDEKFTAPNANSNSWSDLMAARSERPSWSEEWKRLGLGAELIDDDNDDDNGFPRNLFFVQLGFGVDQHGDRQNDGFATKAAVRAVRNAIEFNSIPGVIDHIPGGRKGMLIHVRLGVPPPSNRPGEALASVDALEVAKVFPYGKLLPIEVVVGGLEFHSGRVVEELGDDDDDVGVCCVACVSIGYNGESDDNDSDHNKSTTDAGTVHRTYSTKDGY
mmetsp:Transcript_28285/g.66405  ORF Transcript_28285/g.66405 Transcript_28285/m.66405 type:complete len:288 (-) Transcript_28285:1109-1972(-)